jgi:multidrug resistance efflux pump
VHALQDAQQLEGCKAELRMLGSQNTELRKQLQDSEALCKEVQDDLERRQQLLLLVTEEVIGLRAQRDAAEASGAASSKVGQAWWLPVVLQLPASCISGR